MSKLVIVVGQSIKEVLSSNFVAKYKCCPVTERDTVVRNSLVIKRAKMKTLILLYLQITE